MIPSTNAEVTEYRDRAVKFLNSKLNAFRLAEDKGRVFNVFEQNHIADLRDLRKILEGK